jgi:hypothetical protein
LAGVFLATVFTTAFFAGVFLITFFGAAFFEEALVVGAFFIVLGLA